MKLINSNVTGVRIVIVFAHIVKVKEAQLG